ncbi:MAG: hypothetical protein ACLFO5_08400, partial [Opitutales bacterium]
GVVEWWSADPRGGFPSLDSAGFRFAQWVRVEGPPYSSSALVDPQPVFRRLFAFSEPAALEASGSSAYENGWRVLRAALIPIAVRVVANPPSNRNNTIV